MLDDTTRQLLGDDFAKQLIKEMGIEGEPQEAQAVVIAGLGENILNRITLELLKTLPETEHEKFSSLVGGGDMNALRAFLAVHIDDVDTFMQKTAREEYEATKKLWEEADAAAAE